MFNLKNCSRHLAFPVAFGLLLAALSARGQVIVQLGQNFPGSGNSQTHVTPADGKRDSEYRRVYLNRKKKKDGKEKS